MYCAYIPTPVGFEPTRGDPVGLSRVAYWVLDTRDCCLPPLRIVGDLVALATEPRWPYRAEAAGFDSYWVI